MKIAVVGPGLMGLEHAARIRRADGLALAGFVHPAGRAPCRAEFEGLPVAASIGALAELTDIDGAIVATPNRRHVEDVEQCAALGLPMLVEKPLADTLAGARKAVEILERRAIPALVGYHRLYSPVVEAAAAVLASGTLGELVCVRGSAKYLKPPGYFERAWRTESGGGPIRINFVHDIASLAYLLGRIEAVQATASSRRRGFGVEDTAAVILSFEGGVLGSFLISDCAASCESWEAASGENPRFPRSPEEACYEISGRTGSLKVPNLELVEADPRQPSWETPFRRSPIGTNPGDPWDRQLRHFADVVAGKSAPFVTPRFGLHVAAVVWAIGESAATGSRVAVPVDTWARIEAR